MILRKLQIENVKCFENIEIDFVPGKNVLLGHNGSGKSTILQSILYSLFHEYPEGKLPGLIRHGEKTAEFELEFEHNGRQYIVDRKLWESGRREAYLTEKGKPDLLAETQTGVTIAVSEILQTRKEVFRDVILVRQGEIAQIITMSSRDRKILFDKLLGIHGYEQAWSKCRLLNGTLKNKLSESEKIMDAHGPIADQLQERKARLAGFKRERKEKRGILSGLRAELKAVKTEWTAQNDLEKRIGILVTQMEGLETALKEDEEKANEYRSGIGALCDDLEITQPVRLQTLLINSEKQHRKAKREIDVQREQYNALLGKEGELASCHRSREQLQDDVDGLHAVIDEVVETVLEELPRLKKQPYEKWPEQIKQEIDSVKAKKTEVSDALKDAEKVDRKRERLSEKIQGFVDAVSCIQKQTTRNNKSATSVGGSSWREIAAQSLSEAQKRLANTGGFRNETEKELYGLTGKVGRAESNSERLKRELTDLEGLVGKKCPKCKQLVDEAHAVKLQAKITSELKTADKLLVSLGKKHKTVEKELHDLKAQEEELETTVRLIEQLGIYQKTERDSQKELAKIEPKLSAAKELVDKLESKLSQVNIDVLKEDESKLEERLEVARDLGRKVSALLRDLPNLKKKKKALEIVDELIVDMQALSLDSSIPEMAESIKSLEQRRDQLRNLVDKTRLRIGLEGEMRDTSTKLRKKNRELSKIEGQFNQEKYDELNRTFNELQDMETTVKTEVRVLTDDQIPTAKELYDESKDAMDTIEELRLDHERATRALEVLSKIREFYREIQRPLRKRDTRRASSHATEVFKSLIGTNEFDRVMITEDHDLLVSRFGELEPMSALSGGEQVLASLAVRLGFARALVDSDLLILDEPTAFLDDIRKAELVDTLYHASPTRQMLIVTHDDDFQRVAQKVIRVGKDEATLVSEVRTSSSTPF